MMKSPMLCIATLLLALVPTTIARGFSPADPAEVQIYNARLSPAPRNVQFGRGVVVLNERLRCVMLASDELKNQSDFSKEMDSLQTNVSRYFATKIFFENKSIGEFVEELKTGDEKSPELIEFVQKISQDESFFQTENAYRCLALADPEIDASNLEEVVARQDGSKGALIVVASDLAGFRDSFKTLRQLAETFGVSQTTEKSRYFLPELEIDDSPIMSFRGIHLCWFPETKASSIERSIRIATYYKFNYIVLEFWGVFPFESSDALSWEEFRTSKEEVRRLVKLAKSLGATLIPQFNLLGHAPGARHASGKHAILDFHPEMEPLFEPDGWTWNIYNPAARDLLAKCVLELYDAFDCPPYFHVGCDEAYSAGTNLVARRKGNYVDALADWLCFFHDLLQERQCRMMMWHDMLIEPSEFPGYTAGGQAKTRGLIDKLPKDVLICDWEYGKPKENETWPTVAHFSEKGFDVVLCPWRDASGIRSLGRRVVEKDKFGLLCTTWHVFYGTDEPRILAVGAHAAWGTRYQGGDPFGSVFNRHLRQALSDQVDKDYRTGGVNDYQVPLETYVPF